MKDNDPRLEEFKRAYEIKKKKKEHGRYLVLLNEYRKRINKGDWRYIVPEFEDYDAFEKYKEQLGKDTDIPEWGEKPTQDELDNNIKIEDRSVNTMAKREVEIRLSKDYNVGAVNVREIESEEEFEYQRDWALSQARDIWSQLPNKENGNKGYKTSKQGFNNQVKQEQAQQGNGNYPPMTRQARGYGSGKQWNIVKKNISKLEQSAEHRPETINNYQDLQSAIKYIFNN